MPVKRLHPLVPSNLHDAKRIQATPRGSQPRVYNSVSSPNSVSSACVNDGLVSLIARR